jgi:hypothetical protein
MKTDRWKFANNVVHSSLLEIPKKEQRAISEANSIWDLIKSEKRSKISRFVEDAEDMLGFFLRINVKIFQLVYLRM